jgi:hypothetical protein
MEGDYEPEVEESSRKKKKKDKSADSLDDDFSHLLGSTEGEEGEEGEDDDEEEEEQKQEKEIELPKKIIIPPTAPISLESSKPMEIPYTIPAPTELQELSQLMKGRPVEQYSVVFQRIRTCNHISLNPSNRQKMEVPFNYYFKNSF